MSEANPILVRPAAVEDLAFVRTLAAESIVHGIPAGRDAKPEEVRANTHQSYATLERDYPAALARDVVILVAEENRDGVVRLVGYIILDFTSIEPATGEPQCFICDLAVEPAAWGEGAAEKLVERASHMAAGKGLKYLVGMVSTSNPRPLAIAQGKLGFTIERHQIMRRCDLLAQEDRAVQGPASE